MNNKIFFFNQDFNLLLNFGIGVFTAFIVAILSYKVKFLTLSGSYATFILASLIFGFGGIKWSVPIMVFFIFSSQLSKYRKRVNENVETYFEKSGIRDAMQVTANGGIGGILVLLYFVTRKEIYYLIYSASLAAVCADTWATEIGTLHKAKTYNILNFKPINQGMSGGVSINGFIGAAAGALVIALSAGYWIEYDLLSSLTLIVVSGILGSILDSILGASIQAQYKCHKCGKITEKIYHCDVKASYNQGLIWLNNDFVNLLAGIGGGIFFYFIKEFLSI